jgi:phosphoglycerate dehydrogenase-like enzyme
MNRLKEQCIKFLISARKSHWRFDDKTKVAIAVNEYFTERSWDETFATFFGPKVNPWDVVYCHNKIDVYQYVPSADICFIYRLNDFMLEQLKSPKMIYFPNLGLDFFKSKSFPDYLIIEQPPPYSAQTIAEYCIAMSIILTRNLHKSFENRAAKQWKQNNILPHSLISIRQCKIGVLGMGRVGKVIAENFKNIGCEVIGCDKITPQNINVLKVFYPSDKLYDFLENIDILIIALPLSESTEKLIDYRALQRLGKEKYLINISRGEIIDEKALILALSTNILKKAAIDVFEHEPLPRSSGLYRYRDVVITPHIAGNINLFVNEIQFDFIRKAVENRQNV